jgi:poly(A) polymerase
MARVEGQHYVAALRIVRRLRALGHMAYFAGGCVRDLLLGVVPKDFDVATSATPKLVLAAFPRTEAVGAHFGVVLVIDHLAHERVTTEVATFRHDGAYTDGRRPDAVQFSLDPREDVLRRDFTINGLLLDAMAYEAGDRLEDCVLDYVGGRGDLHARLVRAIGEPKLRFAEDKLRMLRAVRFAARLEFAIERRTMDAIWQQAATIHVVSAERVRDELTKILTEGGARRGLELLDETRLLAEILPEVKRMQGVEQPPEYHPEGDVWVHTLMLLEQLDASVEGPGLKPNVVGPHNRGLKLPSPPGVGTAHSGVSVGNSGSSARGSGAGARGSGVSATLAWGMLLHDVGKPATFTPPDPARPGDRIRFNGHVDVGVAVARTILTRLRFSNEECEQILALIKHHMQFGDVMQMKQSTLKRFLRLPKFEEHLALHRADCLSSHGRLDMYEYAKKHLEEMGEEEIRPALLLTGDDLIAAGYKPGPRFKTMLEAAEDAQLEGSVKTKKQALRLVREMFPG